MVTAAADYLVGVVWVEPSSNQFATDHLNLLHFGFFAVRRSEVKVQHIGHAFHDLPAPFSCQ